MKISRHADGSYSITEMTRDDINNLHFGASCATTFYVEPRTGLEPDWQSTQLATFERLYQILHAVEQSRSKGSVVVQSDEFGTRTSSYRTVKRTGLLGWDGENPFEHIEKKEAQS